MLKPVTSDDPRYHEFMALRVSDPKCLNTTCYPYAVADDATIAEYAARPRDKVWRPPMIGDGWGLNVKLYGLVNRVTAQTVCEFAERDGLKPVKVDMFDPLPVASPGHRLVAIMYGRRDGQFEYHSLREHGGIWSHKFGNASKPSIHDFSSEPQVITDPRKAKFYDMQQGPFFFEVPNAGLDLRIRPELGEVIDNIQSAHQVFEEQARKRRVNLVNPRLAGEFRKLAQLVGSKNPVYARQLDGLIHLHTTGKPPAGVQLRPGVFRGP